jgi:hypothetical protein
VPVVSLRGIDWRRCTALLFLLCWLGPAAADGGNPTPAYPHVYESAAGRVTIKQPVIFDWAGFETLSGSFPLQIETPDGETWNGTAAFEVATQILPEERQVDLDDLQLKSFDFGRTALPASLQRLAREALEAGADAVSLDAVVRALPEDFEIPGAGPDAPRLNQSPPRIVTAERPMRLMLIDGQPVLRPIESSGLEYVINTDWDVFHLKSPERWFILDDGHWLTNTMLASGDWLSTTDLPAEIRNLEFNSYWPQVREALPPRPPDAKPLPFTISYEPTELVVIDGPEQLEVIPGTVLRFVKNTRSDLFVLAGRYYLLVSGRWFTTKNLKRMWSAVDPLPAAFAEIPPDHEKSHVRASVPGTQEARIAMIQAAIPRYTMVSLDAGSGIEIQYAGEPVFVPIEGTALERAENTPFQVIRHNNFYYLCHEGAWYSSTKPQGPWQVATEIPEAVYTIPPTDPAYNVTFVRLDSFDDSSNRAAFRKTAGYHRIYSNGYSMVHGTGWYYPGHVQTNPYGYDYYWRYPYTYGHGAWYNPYFGGYGFRGYSGYYPYSSGFSVTVDSSETDWKWGIEDGKRRVYEYAPQNTIGSGQYILPDGSIYRGEEGQ